MTDRIHSDADIGREFTEAWAAIREGRMKDEYAEFIERKSQIVAASGFTVDPSSLNAALKPFQRDIVLWALRRGRAALFEGTGLGKTLQQLAWADAVEHHAGAPVLIHTPLAVAQQTVAEAAKFGIEGVAYAADEAHANTRIVVTNYDRMHHFDPDRYGAIVLDESSCIKASDSKTRVELIQRHAQTPFRLCCTATPAPNDYVELGNHSEFLGVMREPEMLAMYFVHDGSVRAGGGAEWRLKGHAEQAFWRWLASWSVLIRSPADIGYDEPGYVLPPLRQRQVTVRAPIGALEGELFARQASTLSERISARRNTVAERVKAAADIVNAQPDRPWLVWCGLNTEADALVKAIPGAIEVRGSDDADTKAERLLGFANGQHRILVTKASIAGFGMNLQICADMVFVGMNDSFEQLFQAMRRCWRFGQTRPVNAYLIAADIEGSVVANLAAKEKAFDEMCSAMVDHMREMSTRQIHGEQDRAPMRSANIKMDLPNWLVSA